MKTHENTELFIPEYIKLKGSPDFVDCENIWCLRRSEWSKDGFVNCIMKNTTTNRNNSQDWCPAPTANEMLAALPYAVDLDTSQDQLFYLRLQKLKNDSNEDCYKVGYYRNYSTGCFACNATKPADAMVYVYNRLVDVGIIKK